MATLIYNFMIRIFIFPVKFVDDLSLFSRVFHSTSEDIMFT